MSVNDSRSGTDLCHTGGTLRLRGYRRALFSSTALVGIAIVGAAALPTAIHFTGPAYSAPGAGGGAPGGGAAGGAGGTPGNAGVGRPATDDPNVPNTGGTAGGANGGAGGAATPGSAGGGGGGGGGAASGGALAAGGTGGTGGDGGAGSNNLTVGGGGGGGGEGAAGVITATAVGGAGLAANATGGNGGSGGLGGGIAAGAGNGGDGGAGVAITAGGQTLDINATFTALGGNGGQAGGPGGFGGTGGAGVLSTGGDLIINNNGAITGGNGGAANGGAAGLGGAGIRGAGLTITNTGLIEGGLGNAGNGARANSITFTGGANTLAFGGVTGTPTADGLTGSVEIIGGGSTLSLNANAGGTNLDDAITGAGALTVASGAMTLSGANTYTGATTIDGGATLVASNATALGTTAAGTTVANGGNLTIANVAIGAEGVTLNGGAGAALSGTGASASLAGPITLNATSTIDTATTGDALTLSGVISQNVGPFGITKTGAGTLSLTGAAANIYTGPTLLQGGILQVGKTQALGTGGRLTFSAGTELRLFAPAGTDPSLSVSLDNPITVGTAGTSTVNVQTGGTAGTGTLTLSVPITAAATADILAKTGAGRLNLTGSNTLTDSFNGTFNVTAGTVSLGNGAATTFGNTDGVSTNGTINVQGGTLLAGIGTVATNINHTSGTISAGNSPGVTTVQGNYAVSGGTTLFELRSPGQGGGTNDQFVIQAAPAPSTEPGNLTITGGTLQLVNDLTAPTTTAAAGVYRLYTYTGTFNGGAFASIIGGGTTPPTLTQSTTNAAGNVDVYATSLAGPGSLNVRIFNGVRISQLWDGTAANEATAGGQGGTGTWDANTINWAETGAALNDRWRSGEGTFGGATGTVTVSGTQAFERLNFTTTGYTIQGDAIQGRTDSDPGGAITALNLAALTATDPTTVTTGTTSGVGTAAPAATATANATISVDPGLTATINSVIGGTAISPVPPRTTGLTTGLLKIGTGTLVVGGQNTYTGDTRIQAGTLQVTASGGSTNRIPDFNLANGIFGRVILDPGTAPATSTTLRISADETIGSVETPVGGGANTRVTVDPGFTLTMNGGLNTTYAGVFTGTNATTSVVTKSGPGLLTVTGTNAAGADNFIGTFNANAGTLRVSGTLGDVVTPTTTATVNVGAAGTLQGGTNDGITVTPGTLAANVTLDAGGTLSPGQNAVAGEAFAGGSAAAAAAQFQRVGTFNITQNGSLALNSGTSIFDLGTPGTAGGVTNDLVSIAGGTGTLTITGGNVTAANSATPGATVAPGAYQLVRLTTGNAVFGLAGPPLTLTLPTGQSGELYRSDGSLNLRVFGSGRLSQFWDGSDLSGRANPGGQGGTGIWTEFNTNWSDSATVGDVNDRWRSGEGTFGGPQVGRAVTVNGTHAFERLNFVVDGYTLTSGVAGVLQGIADSNPGGTLPTLAALTATDPTVITNGTASGVGTAAPAAVETANATINVTTGNTATLNLPVAGTGIVRTGTTGLTTGLLKIGEGTLVLGGQNTYTGDTRIQAGTLQVTAFGGSTSRIPDFNLANGIFGRVILDPGTVGVPTTFRVSADETIGSVESPTTGGANSRVVVDAATTLTMNGGLNTTFGGVFTGANAATSIVTKNGTGLLALDTSSVNTTTDNFLGTMNVTNGTLRVNGRFGDVANAVPTATLNVNTAGVLQGGAAANGTVLPATGGAITVGRIDANVTIGDPVLGGGTLAPGQNPVAGEANPGTPVSTLYIAGSLTLNGGPAANAGSLSQFDLSGSAGTRNATNDLVIVGGAMTINGVASTGARLQLDGAPISGVYRLFEAAGGVTGNFNAGNITATGVAPGSTAVTYLAPVPSPAVPGLPTQVNARINLAGPGGLQQRVQFWDGADVTGVDGVTNPQGGAGAQGGTGTWNNTFTNWTNEAASTGNSNLPSTGGDVNDSWHGQVAVFGTAGGTVTLGDTVALEGAQFTANGYTIAGGALVSINLVGDSAVDPANTFFNVDAGVTALITANITGAAGLRTRVGTGTLQIGGQATYTGATTTDSGTNIVVVAGGNITGTSNVLNNGTFRVNAGGAVTTAVAGSVVNNGTFTIDGPAPGPVAAGSVTTATVTNNSGATFNSAGTLNGTTSVTNNGGGTFNLSGGTVTTPTFTNESGGALNSTGGAITAPTFINRGTVTGLLTVTGNTTATNTASGTINDGIAIAAAPGGATFANAGTAGTGGLVLANIGGTLTANNTGTFNGFFSGAAGTTTTVNNSATWNYQGVATLNGAEIINNTATFNVAGGGSALNGLETFNNQSGGRFALTAASLGGSIATFNNNATNPGSANLGSPGNGGGQGVFTGAGVFLQDRDLTGITTFNNNGFLGAVTGAGGANNTIGAATFNNQSNGVVSLVNGIPTDRLTLTGNYNGAAGSVIALDVDLNQAASRRRGDVVTINGQNNGQTALVLNRLDDPSSTLFSSTPVPVVVSGGGAGQVTLAQPLQGNGFVTFELENNGPGSYQIVSRLNTSAASGAASSISALLTSLNVGFFQSVSAFIGAPSANNDERTASTSVSSDPTMNWAQLNRAAAAQSEVAPAPGIRPNTISSGLWARGSGGEFTVRGTSTAIFGATSVPQAVRVENSFAGMQVGIDTGVFNIDNTGWNLHLGITGGSVFADGRQTIGSLTTGVFDVPFIGIYGALTNGPFFSDLSYRHDFFNARISNQLAGLNNARLQVSSDSVAGSAGYRFDFENLFGSELPYFIEPSGSMSYTKTNIGSLPVTGGVLQFRDIDSILGRFGLRFGTAFQATENLALQPFITGSVWHEFAGNTISRFVSANIANDPNAFVPIITDRVGTFGQVGVGISGQLLDTPLLGYVRSDFRFGDKLEGYAVNGGIRYQF